MLALQQTWNARKPRIPPHCLRRARRMHATLHFFPPLVTLPGSHNQLYKSLPISTDKLFYFFFPHFYKDWGFFSTTEKVLKRVSELHGFLLHVSMKTMKIETMRTESIHLRGIFMNRRWWPHQMFALDWEVPNSAALVILALQVWNSYLYLGNTKQDYMIVKMTFFLTALNFRSVAININNT